MFSLKLFLTRCVAGLGVGLLAFQVNAQGSSSSAYLVELSPTIGIGLAPEITAGEGIYRVWGLRASTPAGPGAFEAGFLMQQKSPDKAYTFDGGYRFEYMSSGVNAYGSVGAHFSNYKIKPKAQSNGEGCTSTNCETDSGKHFGFYAGGGLIFPIVPQVPVRVGFRYYIQPSYWMLLELAVGYRF